MVVVTPPLLGSQICAAIVLEGLQVSIFVLLLVMEARLLSALDPVDHHAGPDAEKKSSTEQQMYRGFLIGRNMQDDDLQQACDHQDRPTIERNIQLEWVVRS